MGTDRASKKRAHWLVLVWLGGLLAGCLQPAPLEEGGAVVEHTPVEHMPEVTPSPVDTPPDNSPEAVSPGETAASDGPAILLMQPVGAGAVAVIRYPAGTDTCLAASFELRVLEHVRCGSFSGAGVGFLASLTDPGGQAVRVAYGAVFDPAITAVAVEFAEGGNANAPVQQGGYLLLLQPGQTPRRAVGVNQFGNLVGNWAFN